MSRFYTDGFQHLVAWLIICVTTVTAFAQSVPDQYLGGVVLDEPLPAQFVSGQTYWVVA